MTNDTIKKALIKELVDAFEKRLTTTLVSREVMEGQVERIIEIYEPHFKPVPQPKPAPDIAAELMELHKRHKVVMDTKNILVSVYTNASGFLWSMMKVDSGTGLGWSNHTGDCEHSGAFTSYEKALENALNLIDKCDLKTFQKECPNNKFHWGNYAQWLIDKK